MAKDKILCLVTGPSGSGKTSIALELQKRLSETEPTLTGCKKQTVDGDKVGDLTLLTAKPEHPVSVVVIHQDHYFTKPFLPYQERVDDSYENSSGINWDGLLADVQSELEESDRDRIEHNETCDKVLKIVIVEGHLLGDAAAQFRQRFFRETIGILGVFLVGCSQESCKHRRLERKKDRTMEEGKELADYIDAFVWPSFLKYGVNTMDALRRCIVEAAASTAKSTFKNASALESTKDRTRETNKPVAVAVDIDNSEKANLRENVDEILDWVCNILSVN